MENEHDEPENRTGNEQAQFCENGIVCRAWQLPADYFLNPHIAQRAPSIGAKTIRTLSDGSMTFPTGFMFPDVPQDQLLPFLQANGFGTETIERPCNLTLVDDGERRILFDAGAGSNFMPSTGKVIETLDAAGIALDSITDVIFTHGHPDHLWGIWMNLTK